MSIEQTDAESAAVAKNPEGRVSLAQIEAAIASRYDVNGWDAAGVGVAAPGLDGLRFGFLYNPLAILSMCILVMKNGFVVVGKSAPADPKNFNAALGRKFAYEDAIRQLWPLMAFSLKDRTLGGED